MEERIEKHIHQYVEAELRNYRTYKKLIGEYDKELLYRGVKSGLGKDSTGRFSQNQISDPTHDEVAKVMANEQRVRRMKDVVMCIEDVLEELSEEETRLVEMKYFKSCYTDFGIIGELHIGQTKYYGDKKRIIRKFALRMRLI